MTEPNRGLAQDILPSINSICEYVYGESSPSKVRRLRHMIDAHGFPAKKVAGRIESRRSWIDAYYATPDSADGGQISTTKGGHLRLEHPEASGPVFTGSTPSDRRALHNARAAMKRVRRPKTEG
jgi:hypothetical protein